MRSALGIGLATVVLAVCANGAAAGAAPPRKHLLARETLRAVTDGSRYLAVLTRPGRIRLVDTRRRHGRTVAVTPGCAPAEAWSGNFLVNCSTPAGATPYILHARSGRVTLVPGFGRTFSQGSDYFGEIGRFWLAGQNGESGRVAVEYLNWHSGELRNMGDVEEDPVPRDLDSASLRPLPAARNRAVFARAGRFTVEQGSSSRSRLVLRSGRRRVALDRCASFCANVSLGGGWVTWTSGHFAHAYRLSTGRRLAWHFAAFDEPLFLEHTARAIFFDMGAYSGSNLAGLRLYEARLR